MKNSVINFSLISLFVAMLSGCEPGFYEQKLNSKIDDHLKVIRKLNAKIAETESEIQRSEKLGPKSAPNPIPRAIPLIENRNDFILLQKHCQVASKWFDTNSADGAKKLLLAIDSNKEINFENEACIRISCEEFQISDLVSLSNQRRFIKPSPEPRENNFRLIPTGPFGNPLNQFFHPRSFEVTPDGTSNQISAAYDPDQEVIQLEISHQNFTNASIVHIPFLNRENSVSSELFVSIAPPLKSPTERRFSVRLSPSTWILAAAIPLADDPERVSLHFLKVIEVN